MEVQDLFEAKYEDNYLRRELGDVVTQPDVAITELVANAYDAGAGKVKIIIPGDFNQTLAIEDDGVGMAEAHLQNRWMMMRYNRLQHQGPNVDFPPERQGVKRKAFGRNGIGRHGLLCFGDDYSIETWRDGICTTLKIAIGDHEKPLRVLSSKTGTKKGHGTRLTVSVTQNLWSGERIAEMLSTRFISMPDFTIYVNGNEVKLDNHPGYVCQDHLSVEGVTLGVTIIDTKLARKSSKFQGVGIWVGGRRVGEMEWRLGPVSFADARRTFSKRFAIIVQTDGLRDEIAEDWSSFKAGSKIIQSVAEGLAHYINKAQRGFVWVIFA